MKPYRIKTTSPEFRALDECTKKLAKLYGARKYGENVCFTCKNKKDKIVAGHFLGKEKLIYRWNLNNIRPQCVWCNRERSASDMLFNFERNLWDEVGKDEVDTMKTIYLGLSNEKFKIDFSLCVIIAMIMNLEKLFEKENHELPKGKNLIKKYRSNAHEYNGVYVNFLTGNRADYLLGIGGKESP